MIPDERDLRRIPAAFLPADPPFFDGTIGSPGIQKTAKSKGVRDPGAGKEITS